MSRSPNWGPSHQLTRQRAPTYKRAIRLLVALAVFGAVSGGARHDSPATTVHAAVVLAVIAWFGLPARMQRWTLAPLRSLPGSLRPRRRRGPGGDPLSVVRRDALRHGGGVYLGRSAKGGARHARRERAVLVIGPPRSGKTSAVIIPALVAHTGPAVSTSTKPDVAHATHQARSRAGQVWMFDPTGAAGGGRVGGELRWSPVCSSGSWDGALVMARAMTSNLGVGTTDRSHWSNRAQALLAPMLHAAAVHDQGMDVVVEWVMRHELDPAGILLEDERCSRLAFGSLLGILHTEDRERSSIFSATADALQAYTSDHALAAARDPNFDADQFVRSANTVYIHAPAEQQGAAAPIVCGLLSEIRRAAYRAHAQSAPSRGPVLFALDEVANIAPLEELPQIASEGGGQGLLLLAAIQDLSQARVRWGTQADGFLTLFGTKLILSGVADRQTLETVSTMLGEYDRQMVAHTTPRSGGFLSAVLDPSQPVTRRSTTLSTHRTRVLSPGEIANLPGGRALHLDGTRWELVTLTPAYRTEPWRSLTTPAG